jgi:2-oxopent-4-enoate/cis-2-oxohex-4-enoate hydratase
MALSPSDIARHGDALYNAFVERTTLPNLRDRVSGITVVDAYHIQAHFVARRLATGEALVGRKIGVTSKAIQDAIGVFEPDFGQLTSAMALQNGAMIDLDTLIQPLAEGEMAFVLKQDLAGPGVSASDVLRATDHVSACIEIVDSRIADWDIKIEDTVADNASSGVYALGDVKTDPRDLDLSLAGMLFEKNGRPVATGAGAAVQGSPLSSVAWLANTLGRLGTAFRAGEVILSGSLGPLIPIAGGDQLTVHISGLGSCSIGFSCRDQHA